MPLIAQPGYDDFPVERFTQEQGYNNAEVTCFLQDKKGVLWLGKMDGLYRYDGKFRHYAHQAGNEFSLPKNHVLSLYEDNEGILWVGTKGGGLVRFDRTQERFIQYSHHSGDIGSFSTLSNDVVASIIEDKGNRFWVLTDGGINLFDKSSGRVVRRYTMEVNNGISLAVDASGRLWAASGRYLYWYDENRDSFTKSSIVLPAQANQSLTNSGHDTLWIATPQVQGVNANTASEAIKEAYNSVLAINVREERIVGEFSSDIRGEYIYCAAPDRVWVGTSKGLLKINPLTGIVRRYGKNQGFEHPDPTSLGWDITCVFEDRSGVVWVNERNKWGLAKHAPYKRRFKTYRHNPQDSNSLSGNYARSLLEDSQGNLWVCIQRAGLNKIDRTSGVVTRYISNPRKPHTLLSNEVNALYQTPQGLLWVGTSEGVQIFDPEYPSKGFRPALHHNKSIVSEVSNFRLYSQNQRPKDKLWIGASGSLGSISTEPQSGEPFVPLNIDKTLLPHRFVDVHKVYEDHAGALWIADIFGIYRYDTASKTLHQYKSEVGNPLTIGDNFVTSVMETRSGDVWVSTKGGGIAKYDRERDVFSRVTIENGLPHNNCYGILEDGAGLLWISSDEGLCSYNPKNGVIRRYSMDDGLQGKEFNRYSYFKSASGEMFFGGTDGVNSFFPDLFRDNPSAPLPAIISLHDFANDTTYSIAYRSTLELTYRQNNISIEAAALEFTFPERNLYSWYMEGVDTSWTAAKPERWVTYTNLSPGTYRLMVRVANADGVWNNVPSVLVLSIHPAWWQTWLFRLSLGVVVVVIGYGVFRWRVWRIEEKSRKLELQVEERTKELSEANNKIFNQMEIQAAQAQEIQIANTQLQEINEELHESNRNLNEANQFKTEMLSVAAHDLKNPLAAILGLVEVLTETLGPDKEESSKLVEYIGSTADRMHHLIVDILDTAAVEMGKIDIIKQPIDIAALVNEIIESYHKAATDKQQTITLFSPQEFWIEASWPRMRQVMENLVSNAVKYSPLGKTIWVRIEKKDDLARVSVADEGPGLSEEDKTKLFGHFQRLSAQPTGGETSNGVGLAIVKQIVELHGGRVWCESELGKGATFIVELPLVS